MIPNKLYRLFAAVMAVVVLLSSTGFGVVEHSCMMRGKSVGMVTMSTGSSGCQACVKKPSAEQHKAAQSYFKKKACCEENQKHQKIEVTSSLSQASSKVLKAKVLSADVAFQVSLLLSLWEQDTIALPTHSLLSFSSRHYGRSMLSFVQSFLI